MHVRLNPDDVHTPQGTKADLIVHVDGKVTVTVRTDTGAAADCLEATAPLVDALGDVIAREYAADFQGARPPVPAGRDRQVSTTKVQMTTVETLRREVRDSYGKGDRVCALLERGSESTITVLLDAQAIRAGDAAALAEVEGTCLFISQDPAAADADYTGMHNRLARRLRLLRRRAPTDERARTSYLCAVEHWIDRLRRLRDSWKGDHLKLD